MTFNLLGLWFSVIAAIFVLGMGSYWASRLVKDLMCEYLLPWLKLFARKYHIAKELKDLRLFKIGPTFATHITKNIGFWIVFTDDKEQR